MSEKNEQLNHDQEELAESSETQVLGSGLIQQLKDKWTQLTQRQPRPTTSQRKSGFSKHQFWNRFKRQGRHKIFVLKGYTTRERIAQKRMREKKIRRNIYITVAVLYVILLAILFYTLDPIGRLSELQRMLGF